MYYRRHLELARAAVAKLGEGNALWNISLVLDGLGDRVKAIAHAEDAYNIYKEIESPYSKKVLDRLAEWHMQDQFKRNTS